jgi:protein-disulfide isomerase
VHEIMRRHPHDVRLVLRYTPLHGPSSEEAVRIIETARLQNKFEPVLSAMFQAQPQWAAHEGPRMELAWDAAAGAGLDVNAARAAMNSRRINTAISQDVADATALNVRGTPTFFVNEQLLTNFGPQQLYDLVLSELAATE